MGEQIRKEGFLRKVQAFKHLSEKDLALLVDFFDIETFSKGERIRKQGDLGGDFYLLKKGLAEVSIYLPGDRERVLGNFEPGDSFGEVMLLSTGTVIASVFALEETTCLVLNREKLNSLRWSHPLLFTEIQKGIAESGFEKIQLILDLLHTLRQEITEKFPSQQDEFIVEKKEKYEVVKENNSQIDSFQESQFFQSFTKEELNELILFCEVRRYQKGSFIRPEENGEKVLVFVSHGALQLFDDYIPKLCIIEPGQLFGQLSFINKEVYLGAVARENVLLCLFKEGQLNRLKQKNQKLYMKLQRVIYHSVVSFLYVLDRQLIGLDAEYPSIILEESCVV